MIITDNNIDNKIVKISYNENYVVTESKKIAGQILLPGLVEYGYYADVMFTFKDG